MPRGCVSGRQARLSPLFLFQENDVTKLYMELAAENKQQLSRLEFARKIVEKVPANSSWQGRAALDWAALGWALKGSFQSCQQSAQLGSLQPSPGLCAQV